jgi:aminopeptidase C
MIMMFLQKWEFENSWGEDAGNKGYLTFTDNWFNEYMFPLCYKTRKYLDSKAIGMPWPENISCFLLGIT